MADKDGTMDPITAHAREETKDIPQHVAVQRMMLCAKSMKRPGGVLCPGTYQAVVRYRPSVRGHQCRPSIRGHQHGPSIKGRRSRPNTRRTTERTDQEQSTVQTHTQKHVGRSEEENGGGGTQKEENSAIGAGEPSSRNPKGVCCSGEDVQFRTRKQTREHRAKRTQHERSQCQSQ